MPKTIYQLILGVCVLSLTVAACNGKGEKKETVDTTTIKMDQAPVPGKDTTKMDTINGGTRPVKPGD